MIAPEAPTKGHLGSNHGPACQPTYGGRLLAGQAADAAVEQVGALREPDAFAPGAAGRAPGCEGEDGGCESQRLPACGAVVRLDLRLICDVVGETPECRQPEERERQEREQGEAQRVAPGGVRPLVGDERLQVVGAQALREGFGDVDARAEPPAVNASVGRP